MNAKIGEDNAEYLERVKIVGPRATLLDTIREGKSDVNEITSILSTAKPTSETQPKLEYKCGAKFSDVPTYHHHRMKQGHL